MLEKQVLQLEERNIAWNSTSSFKVKFYNTGSFFEITNSRGKVHDLSFQSVLRSLEDIQNSNKAKKYIIESGLNPNDVSNDQSIEQNKFDNITVKNSDECTVWKYFEKVVRVIGNSVLTHPRAKVVAAEQSKLFFNVISRIVCIANNIPSTNIDEEIPFTNNNIDSAIKYLKEIIPLFSPKTNTNAETPVNKIITPEYNTIYMGAPGTGKSYSIEHKTAGSIKIRTVFHLDIQHSDFIGSLRPRMIGSDASRTISYEFRPGPFTNAYIQAMNHSDQRVYLIIEEVNRANAAAVFGDIFQLLDQDSNYEIDIDPDMLDYINTHIPVAIEKLSMPHNLTILATMNSSDQGINSLDAAFKRRWATKYIPINYSNAAQGTLSIPVQGESYNIEWRDFARVVNERLIELDVPEDRLLGHRFLSISDLRDKESARDALRYKLFVYLWEDVLRHGKRQSVFATETAGKNIGTFGQLVAAFSAGHSIFESSLEEVLIAECKESAESIEDTESTESTESTKDTESTEYHVQLAGNN